MKKTLPVMAAVFCAAVLPLTARANLLTNGGLEVTPTQLTSDPTLLYPDGLIHASYAIHSTALTGWTIGGACIDVVPAAYWQNMEGGYSVDLIGTSGIGSISQLVSGLTIGTQYELSFEFSVNPEISQGEGGSTKILQVSVAGGTATSGAQFSDVDGTRTKTAMQWALETFDFTADASSVTLKLEALMPTGLVGTFVPNTVFCGPVVDALDLEALGGAGQTPEPASLGLLGIGGLALLRRQRRR